MAKRIHFSQSQIFPFTLFPPTFPVYSRVTHLDSGNIFKFVSGKNRCSVLLKFIRCAVIYICLPGKQRQNYSEIGILLITFVAAHELSTNDGCWISAG
jgi:hypothetical protein